MGDSGGKVILVVDDEEELREITGFELESLGFSCVYASCGRDAWRVWQDDPRIVAVISDIKMVNGDGIRLARDIRSAKPARDTFIVLMSGFVEPGLADGLADHVLEKPIDFDDLAAILKTKLLPMKEAR